MVYLVRINLDIAELKEVQFHPRFKAAVSSVRYYLKKADKIVLLSHRGRPQGKEKKFSLRPFVPLLAKATKHKIIFLPNLRWDKTRRDIKEAPPGSVFLLENLRFHPGETKNDLTLARQLASLGQRYINDDFPTSHRCHASNSALAELLPSALGPNFKEEFDCLKRVVSRPQSPFLLIIGGVKVKDKLAIVKNLMSKVDYVLLGGVPANTVMKARNIDIGRSPYDKGLANQFKFLIRSYKIIHPEDNISHRSMFLDIGPKAINHYVQLIQQARTIIWNGPLGQYENPKYTHGTRAIAKAILANRRAVAIIGGGDTLAALKIRQPVNKNIHLIAGGGAMLYLLAGGKLPAIEAIQT